MNRVIDETEFIVREEAAEKRFTFRKVDFDRDFEMLYEWMHYPHIAPFWKLNLPIPKFKEWLHNSIEAIHKDVFIGTLNGTPVCYLIAYSIKDDPIRGYYDYQEGDLGIHLMIGPRPYLNKDDGLSIIRAMIIFLLDHYGTKRIIGEPDVRNRIVIPILKSLGGEVLGKIELPHKKATLIMGKRLAVEHKMKDDQIQVEMLNKITKTREHVLWQ